MKLEEGMYIRNEDGLYNRLSKGILTDEEIDNLVDEIMNIPSEKNNNCASTYGSINVDDLISNVKEFKKIPTFDNLLKENQQLKEQLQQKEDIINKIREYLTSYESISEIEGLNNVKENKKLDEKTMNEMIRRYMNVHDKILEILDNKGDEK